MARASGIDIDMRKSGYAAYGKLKIEPLLKPPEIAMPEHR